jgi:metal-responsive CopG/Arc/MetJ family transcriptional regulator
MRAKKVAISVPQDVIDDVDRAAAARHVTRSRFITDILRRVSRARRDSEITRRLNELFADESIAREQVETAEAFAHAGHEQGTEW